MMDAKTKECFQQFQQWCEEAPGKIPYSVEFDFAKHDTHIVFSFLVHGDEVGSFPAILRAIHELQSGSLKFGGKVSFCLGNYEAMKVNKRFTEEDLNRCFARQEIDTYEKSRAKELESLIQSSDYFIDFHQTIGPTQAPFYLLSKHLKKSYDFAKLVDEAPYVLLLDEKEESKKYITSMNYASLNESVAFTIELSQKGFAQEAEQKCFRVIEKALYWIEQEQEEINLNKLADGMPELKCLEMNFSQAFTHPKVKLIDGLVNLQKVEKGQILGHDENAEPLLAAKSAYLFFPKYPGRDQNQEALKPLPHYIYVLADEVTPPA